MCDRYHDSNSLPTIGCGTTRRAIDVVFFPQLLELFGGSWLVLCFHCFFAFPASLLSLLLCFCASVPFYAFLLLLFYFFFFQSCVFAALLPAPLLLAASCLYCLCVCVIFFCFILSCCILNENPRETLCPM